jgi:hypothetical protein
VLCQPGRIKALLFCHEFPVKPRPQKAGIGQNLQPKAGFCMCAFTMPSAVSKSSSAWSRICAEGGNIQIIYFRCTRKGQKLPHPLSTLDAGARHMVLGHADGWRQGWRHHAYVPAHLQQGRQGQDALIIFNHHAAHAGACLHNPWDGLGSKILLHLMHPAISIRCCKWTHAWQSDECIHGLWSCMSQKRDLL